MPNSQTPGISGANPMTDTLAFVKNMWGGMGVPGMAVPTMSVDELDKKISDLKAVETWLNINMSMLRGTIQTMEVQRATLASLKSFSATMNAALKTASEPASGQAPAKQAKTEPEARPAEAKDDKQDDMQNAAAMFHAQMVNPAAWWNVLQEQFGQAVTNAMQADAAGKELAGKLTPKGNSGAKAEPLAATEGEDKEKTGTRRRSTPKSS